MLANRKDDRRRNSIVRKFSTVFAVLYVIPTLVTVYILLTLTFDLKGKGLQLIFLMFFCILLGISGYMILRTILKSLVNTVENMKAVASGDLSRRIRDHSDEEMKEVSNYFNKITQRLQKNVEDLKKSKSQIQQLLSHISKAVESPVELEKLSNVYLSSISNIIGYRKGVLTIVTSKGEIILFSNVGLTRDETAAFPVVGKCVIDRVMNEGKPLPVTGESEWTGNGGDFREFRDFIGDSVSVPLIKSQKVFGVLTLAAGKGEHCQENGDVSGSTPVKISGDDLLMLQNLAAQISTALENSELRKRMEKTYFECIAALAAAVEARDIYTNGHSKRVAIFSGEIAKEMNLPESIVELVHNASMLHDIGKIGIPDTILHNSTPKLPDELYEVIKTHPVIGENIVKPLNSLRRLCPGVRHHHERIDGNGYPDGLAGENIPIESRIMAVADAFDAMTSNRPYRRKLSENEAIRELREKSGTQFDAESVKAFLRYYERAPVIDTLPGKVGESLRDIPSP